MKRAWPTASPFASHLTPPFRIMCTVSIPCIVRHGALKRAVAFGQPDSFLYSAVILFDHIINIFAAA